MQTQRRVCARLSIDEHKAVKAAAASAHRTPAAFARELVLLAIANHRERPVQKLPSPEPADAEAAPRRGRTRRPYRNEHRERRVCTYLSAQEHDAMEAVAAHTGLTPAGFAATLLLAAAHAHRARPAGGPLVVVVESASPVEDTLIEELAMLRRALARIGNNLNQIARVLNSGILPDAESVRRDLEVGLGRLASAVASVDSAAHRTATR